MAKKTEIISKWSSKIHRATLNNFIEADKTPTKKYLDYLCKIWYHSRSLSNGSVNKPLTSTSLIKNVLLFDFFPVVTVHLNPDRTGHQLKQHKLLLSNNLINLNIKILSANTSP